MPTIEMPTASRYPGLPAWLDKYDLFQMQWNGTLVYFGIIPVSRIRPNKGQIQGLPANPRRWTKDALERLKKSVKATPELTVARGVLGYPDPNDDTLAALGGNMRLAAGKSLKEKTLPCAIYPEDTPPQKLMEIVAKDNGTFGEFDVDALANEWPDIEWLRDCGIELDVDAQEDGEEEAKNDGFDTGAAHEEAQENPVTQPGDKYYLGDHVLICGDTSDPATLSSLMGEDLADLVVTDPPYNVDYGDKQRRLNESDRGRRLEKNIENDKMDGDSFREFLDSVLANIAAVTKPGGAAYVWMASTEIARCIEAYCAAGFSYKQLLLWVKDMFVVGRSDYQWQHEPCVYGWKEGAAHYFTTSRKKTTIIQDDAPDVDAMSRDEMRDLLQRIFDTTKVPSTVLRFNKPVKSEEHPTTKPVPLIGRCISNSSKKGDIVLDAFCGSGTTLIACEQLGRKCRAVELDPAYCDVIVKRWETLTEQEAVRVPAKMED